MVPTFLYSSLAHPVEHAAVNRRVVGSSPTRGAKKKIPCKNAWDLLLFPYGFSNNPVFQQTHRLFTGSGAAAAGSGVAGRSVSPVGPVGQLA